ncbi:MAG: efflux RND transporter periplasmic adaptor subunit [Burkholderiales bacterium]|nr:efflux RND transporter periplasmic adaptor subunit [Burkholderiales bacterium]
MTEPLAGPAAGTGSLDELLDDATKLPRWRRALPWALVALFVAVAAALWWWQGQRATSAAAHYVTTPIVRGTLAVDVTATGTLQPTRSVAVGSELSGTVVRVLVDVNDHVGKGQLLVELDTARLDDAVTGARADVAAAVARRDQAAATLEEAHAQLARLEELARASGGKLPAAADLDTARAAAKRGAADLASAEAAIVQLRSTLSSALTNRGKAEIRSPIDGVVLARNVEPGNAVAASLQAVTLFTLAEDLTKMQLSVNVDEADVGQLRNGLTAAFTVAAQPGRQYPALVARVAYGSTITDNVVTYTTLLSVDNADLTLRPGMTGTATIKTRQKSGVLLVPNSALRYAPLSASASPAASSGTLVSRLIPRPPPGPARRADDQGAGNGGEGRIWVLRSGQPVALRVVKGLSDGRQTEISGDGLAEGLAVVTDQTTAPK